MERKCRINFPLKISLCLSKICIILSAYFVSRDWNNLDKFDRKFHSMEKFLYLFLLISFHLFSRINISDQHRLSTSTRYIYKI